MVEIDPSRLGELLDESGVDAVLFQHPPNLRQLCGFTGSEAVLLATRGKARLFTDSRYTTQATLQTSNVEVIEVRERAKDLCAFLVQQGLGKVGFEAATLTVSQLQKFQELCSGNLDWVPLVDQLSRLRARKSPRQLEAMLHAAQLNRDAFESILPLVEPGRSESDIAIELECALRRAGGEEKAFDFIVASGERGALPHGVASDKILASGELVTIDFGTRYQGYFSDETVTFALGTVDEKLRNIFDVVLEAHDRAIEAVRPGMALKDLDKVARDIIDSHGFGEFFGHGLGHGVGLEIHEYPVVSPRSKAIAEEGMVVTIEPGIYIPGLGGCRIEDMVVVTPGGCQVLTKIDKQFKVVN